MKDALPRVAMMRHTWLDWIDAILFAFGFTSAIALILVIDELFGIRATGAALMLSLVPSGIRRWLFGPPTTYEPRMGALWSALSVAGILVTFAGVASLAAASVVAFDHETRDFEAEARAIHDSVDKDMGVLSDISFEVIDPNESPQARAARHAREAEARAAEREASIQKLAGEIRRDWEEHRRSRVATMWRVIGAGLGLMVLGALMLRARYFEMDGWSGRLPVAKIVISRRARHSRALRNAFRRRLPGRAGRGRQSLIRGRPGRG